VATFPWIAWQHSCGLGGRIPWNTHGADVAFNVFRHDQLFDEFGAPVFNVGALAQTESGLKQWENLVKVNAMDELGQCDFDDDGRDDAFLATGQTWWYSSGGDRPWVYLHTAPQRRDEVTLRDVTGDGRCDVIADDIVYPGGRPCRSWGCVAVLSDTALEGRVMRPPTPRQVRP
jgi:hypothetical protein